MNGGVETDWHVRRVVPRLEKKCKSCSAELAMVGRLVASIDRVSATHKSASGKHRSIAV